MTNLKATCRLVTIVMLGVATTPPAWSQDLSPTYEIEAAVRVDGKLLGRPTLRVASGEEAVATVEGPNGYRFGITVSPDAADPARVRIGSHLAVPKDGSWVELGRPSASLPLGAEAQVTADAKDGRPAFALAFRPRLAAPAQ